MCAHDFIKTYSRTEEVPWQLNIQFCMYFINPYNTNYTGDDGGNLEKQFLLYSEKTVCE